MSYLGLVQHSRFFLFAVFSLPAAQLVARAADVEVDLAPLEFGSASSTKSSEACELGWGFCSIAGDEADGGRDSAGGTRVLKSETPGAVGQQLGIESNLNVSSSGQAGARASVVGLGRSAEETDVRSLGISLNPPQGGGFDFSAFPSGIWSDWRMSAGQVAGGDVRSSGERFELLPWTAAQVLSGPGAASRVRLLESASTLNVFETSAGWVGSSRAQAAWAGWSLGEVEGPAASVSWLGRAGNWKSDAHLLFSDLLSQSRGSLSFPTPGATQRSQRIIPILGFSRTGTPVGELSIRAYGDWGLLDYSAPSIGYDSKDHSRRLGWVIRAQPESGCSEVGFSAEESRLEQEGGSLSPDPEWSIQAWGRRSWGDLQSIRLEPSVSAIWVTGLSTGGGLQASVLASRALDSLEGLQTRLNLSSKLRVPSLLNRFYESPFFMGNPDLEPERVWGARWSLHFEPRGRPGEEGANFSSDFAVFTDFRENALLTTGVYSPSNSGRARLSGLELNLASKGMPGGLSSDLSIRWTESRVDATGESFPLVPDWSAGGGVHLSRGRHAWSLLGRAVSRFKTGLSSSLPGFALWSAEWSWLPLGEASGFTPRIAVRVDNLADREAAWIPDYPLPGRTFSIALSSDLD